MTGSGPGHAYFDELAAGYALHALEPRDELQFLGHLPACQRCQDAVSDYLEVTAALADTGSAGQPGPQLGDRILAAAAGHEAGHRFGAGSARAAEPAEDYRPGGPAAMAGAAPKPVSELSRHRRRRRLQAVLATAAAAAAIAGGVIWAGPGTGAGHSTPRMSAACARAHQCYEVRLASSRARAGGVATVIVDHGTAWLRPSGLPADRAIGQIYVLWQLSGARTPEAVGSFDIRGRGRQLIEIGSLAIPYRSTWAFAVSLESGRTIPQRPSDHLALGQVPD